MEKRWCKYVEAELSIILTSEITDKLKVMFKKMEFENSKETVALPTVSVGKLHNSNHL